MNKQSADYPETARLSPRMEDYLEVILEFLDTQPVVRVGEISKALQVSKSTVTSALNNLARQGHIEYQSYSYVQLTGQGRRIAEKVRWRHRLLTEFFENILGIDLPRASEDACNAEHYISDETLDRLSSFIEFIHSCPITSRKWLEKFYCYSQGTFEDSEISEVCKQSCLQRCIDELKNASRTTCRVGAGKNQQQG